MRATDSGCGTLGEANVFRLSSPRSDEHLEPRRVLHLLDHLGHCTYGFLDGNSMVWSIDGRYSPHDSDFAIPLRTDADTKDRLSQLDIDKVCQSLPLTTRSKLRTLQALQRRLEASLRVFRFTVHRSRRITGQTKLCG